MVQPKTFHGIMVSSTFSDLYEHREDVNTAIRKLGFHANVMEISGAQADTDVIEASLNMVREAAAFIGVISHRYGQTPTCPTNNPDSLSVSELEFNEAMRLNRPILLFIMGEDHDLKPRDVETDPDKIAKLDAFRERAKKMREGSDVERIYEVFNSREEFSKAAAIAIGRLANSLQSPGTQDDVEDGQGAPRDSIETAIAPDLRAKPRYLGSHAFVGRQAELNTLDDWCADADPNPMLLFEAIGGSGKSMVTWTWLNRHAMQTRDDWAGRFWFSFYEGGATMSRFCREALAYTTGQPVESFRKQHIRDLMPQLLEQLEARPWLIVLDGLERILVAYHRIDAPQMRDEDVDTAEDQMSNRDPRAAINPQDEDLLRLLTNAGPSKILVTSRLTPQALINKSDMPMPGVRREPLPGLRPADAEALFRACGVSGESKAIRTYLQSNCDCHPLVIGALAGLVNNYMADKGNFDAWLTDPQAGGRLGLADLDLTQKRNHILDAAIAALPNADRKLLQTLSLLQGGADYATLKAFNPHLPPPPEEIAEPSPPEDGFLWRRMSVEDKETAREDFEAAKQRHKGYLEAYRTWEKSEEVRTARTRFDETLKQLERRGLLQYEHGLKLYDLHPVVRGVASGRLGETETGEIGEQLVDHFSNRQHAPWEEAESLDELADGIQTVATLTRMGQFERALGVYRGELGRAILFNLAAKNEALRLMRPFFPQGWDGPIALGDARDQFWLLSEVGLAFDNSGVGAKVVERAFSLILTEDDVDSICTALLNLSVKNSGLWKLAPADRISEFSLQLSKAYGSTELIFISLFHQYARAASVGAFERADALWNQLDSLGRAWNRAYYRAGDAEHWRATDLFWRGELTEAKLAEAEQLCRAGRNRDGQLGCMVLRGEWHLSRKEPDLATTPLLEALRLYRDSGRDAPRTEALLTLAQLRAGLNVNGRDVAERLDSDNHCAIALHVAEIWQELYEPERAIAAALRAHKSACADGEPYVYRYYLDRADALMRELGETPPPVPQHDPANDEVFEWEDDVRALIEKTRQEREEREREAAEKEKNEGGE